jgi:hypothetical protein
MARRPLHEFDPVAVGVGQPRGPDSRTRLSRRLGRNALCREASDRGIQIVHLDDQVVDGTDVLDRSLRVVDELEANEGIVRQLQHGQAAEFCLGNNAELGVTESGVEGERLFQIGYPEPEVQQSCTPVGGSMLLWSGKNDLGAGNGSRQPGMGSALKISRAT